MLHSDKGFTDAQRDDIIDGVYRKLLMTTKADVSPSGFTILRATDPIPEEDRPTIKARLVVCRACDKLTHDGCSDCKTCSSIFVAMLKRVASGTCVKFKDHPDAKYQPPVDADGITIQPQREVNGMKVYVYTVTYTMPENPNQKKGMRVVAQGLKDLIAIAEKIEPGATVIGAPTGQPIDAIADGIVPEEIERNNARSAAAATAESVVSTAGEIAAPQ